MKNSSFIFICYVKTVPVYDFKLVWVRLQLHGAIYLPDSFVLMLRYCANLKAIRYESTSLNRIVADKSHLVIVALFYIRLSKNSSKRFTDTAMVYS